MSGKGSGRRPGEGYAEGWDAIFGKKRWAGTAEPECKCTMRERLVGDGCNVCNPELVAEIARQNAEDEQED